MPCMDGRVLGSRPASRHTLAFWGGRAAETAVSPHKQRTTIQNGVRERSAHRPQGRQALGLVVAIAAIQSTGNRRCLRLGRGRGAALLRRQRLLLALSVLGQLPRPDWGAVCRPPRDPVARVADYSRQAELARPAVAGPLDLLRGLEARGIPGRRRRLFAPRRVGVRTSLCTADFSESAPTAGLSLDARRVRRLHW